MGGWGAGGLHGGFRGVQWDFEVFAPVEIIGKCILISRVYYIFRIHYNSNYRGGLS